MNKTISDVLEYLYKNKQKDLAEALIKELKSPQPVTYYPPTIVRSEPPITPPYKVGDTWC